VTEEGDLWVAFFLDAPAPKIICMVFLSIARAWMSQDRDDGLNRNTSAPIAPFKPRMRT